LGPVSWVSTPDLLFAKIEDAKVGEWEAVFSGAAINTVRTD
jgi:hypothetical protein